MKLCCIINGQCYCQANCNNRDTCVFFYCENCLDQHHLADTILLKKIEKYGAGVLSRESIKLAVRRLKRTRP